MNVHRIASVIAVTCLALGLGLAAAPVQSSTAESLFRQGLVKERAEGNLQAAIFCYERVVADFPKERGIAAKAMYQLALAYQKLADPRAKLMLTRLATSYGNIEPFGSRARARLAALQSSAAALFPAREMDEPFSLGSPDGRLAVFQRERDLPRLYLKELDTGTERMVLDARPGWVSNFAWSPDSAKIAYTYRDEKTPIDIRILHLADGKSTSLAVRGYPLGWTDTDEIYSYRPNFPAGVVDYWLVPASGAAGRKVSSTAIQGNDHPVILPDGARVVAVKDKKLALVELATEKTTLITTASGDESGAVVSPDGRAVAFFANHDGDWGVYVARLDGGFPVRPLKIATLSERPWRARGPRHWWTRSGLLTYYVEYKDDHIYRIPVDPNAGVSTDAPQRLTQDAPSNWGPSISPDGKRIAYYYTNGGRSGVAAMDASGANERPLVDLAGFAALHWRSASEILFYDLVPQGGKPAVAAIDIESGARRKVAEVSGMYWRYVPARDEILHHSPGGGWAPAGAVLKAFSLTDGTERAVATIDYLVHFFQPSPDGRRIAYATARPVEGSSERLYELRLMSILGEFQAVLIPAQPAMLVPLAWSPDGRLLLYGEGKQGLKVLDLQTRTSRLLHSATGGGPDGSFTSLAASWSPDGTFITFTVWSKRSERLAWEDVTADAVAKLIEARR